MTHKYYVYPNRATTGFEKEKFRKKTILNNDKRLFISKREDEEERDKLQLFTNDHIKWKHWIKDRIGLVRKLREQSDTDMN